MFVSNENQEIVFSVRPLQLDSVFHRLFVIQKKERANILYVSFYLPNLAISDFHWFSKQKCNEL